MNKGFKIEWLDWTCLNEPSTDEGFMDRTSVPEKNHLENEQKGTKMYDSKQGTNHHSVDFHQPIIWNRVEIDVSRTIVGMPKISGFQGWRKPGI